MTRARYDELTIERCSRELRLPPAAGVQRAPYLQQVGAETGRVLWTSRSKLGHVLELTSPDGRTTSHVATREVTRSLQGATQHQVLLRELAPDSVYCYALRAADGSVGSGGSLRTAPRRGTAAGKRMAFVAFGDSGDGGSGQAAVIEQLQRVHMDLMVVTGDVAYPSGSLDSYEGNYFAMYAPMLASIPVFPTSGNHDYITEQAGPFREVFALPENGGPDGLERWYSFDWGDVHFVALDTERVGPAQTAWLRADLARNTLPWTIALLHKGPYSSGEHGSELAVREAFSPIFESHRVPLVLSGHDHDYERTQTIGGVTYVVTGGGGRGTRAVGTSSFTAFAESVLHFVYVTIEADTLRLYAIDATGREFDFVRLVRPGR